MPHWHGSRGTPDRIRHSRFERNITYIMINFTFGTLFQSVVRQWFCCSFPPLFSPLCQYYTQFSSTGCLPARLLNIFRFTGVKNASECLHLSYTNNFIVETAPLVFLLDERALTQIPIDNDTVLIDAWIITIIIITHNIMKIRLQVRLLF